MERLVVVRVVATDLHNIRPRREVEEPAIAALDECELARDVLEAVPPPELDLRFGTAADQTIDGLHFTVGPLFLRLRIYR
jgi:hypothetical protein